MAIRNFPRFSFYAFMLIDIGSFVYGEAINPASCIPGSGVTTFEQCDYMNDNIKKCTSASASAAYVSCYCRQPLFNAIFGCESEERLCFGNDRLDGSFQTGISLWHSICDGRISFTPTTAPVSTITKSFNPDICTEVDSACNHQQFLVTSCSLSQASKFISCVCQPSILSLEYTCGFIGNTSCLQIPAATTNLAAYRFCSNLPAVLGTTSTPATVSAHATTNSAVTITQPSGPPSAPTTSTMTTSTKASSGNCTSLSLMPLLFLSAAMSLVHGYL